MHAEAELTCATTARALNHEIGRAGPGTSYLLCW
jgi:hypothetical protein